MDLDLAHASAQRVLRQRNVLAVASLVLGVLLVGTFVVAQKRDREVVLVPTLRAPVTLSSAAVAPEYLEMVTRDVAAVALNRSPETLTWWMNSILEFTDEPARGQVGEHGLHIAQEAAAGGGVAGVADGPEAG